MMTAECDHVWVEVSGFVGQFCQRCDVAKDDREGLCVICLHIEGVDVTAVELVPSPDGPEPMCYQHAHAGEGIARGS